LLAIIVMVTVAMTASSISPALADQGGANPGGADPGGEYSFTLSPQNGSGVSGQGTVTVGDDGARDVASIEVQASGLEANETHPMHIHGIEGQDVSCPTGEVGHETMSEEVGPHLLELRPYPVANDAGSVSLERTYSGGTDGLAPLQDRVIAVHGMSMDGAYNEEMPVACAELVSAGESQESQNLPETGGVPFTTLTILTVVAAAAAVLLAGRLGSLLARRH